MKTRTYYSLRDLIKFAYPTLTDVPRNYYVMEPLDFDRIIAAHIGTITMDWTHLHHLWGRISPRHLDSIIFYSDSDLTALEFTTRCAEWLRQYMAIYTRTKDKYVPILNAYGQLKNKLLAEVESTSQSKFNDTPQNQGGQELADDPHVTTITTQKHSTQVGTPAQRLAEITQVWEDTYTEWSKEFRKLFQVGGR